MDSKFFEQHEQLDKYYRLGLSRSIADKIVSSIGDIEFLLKINDMVKEQIKAESDPDYKYQGVGLVEQR